MGREFDIKWQQFEQQAKRSGVLEGMTKAQKQEFYGRMARRIQEQTNKALAEGLAGTVTEPAVMNRAGFIAKYGYDPLVADPLLKDGGKWGGAGLFDKQTTSANPKHPSNTQLGTAHAQPAKPPVSYTKPEVSGVVKNDRIAENIRKGRAEKRRIEQIFGQKPTYTAETINERLGIGKENEALRKLNEDYKFLEGRSDYKRALGKHLAKPTDYSAEAINRRLGIKPALTAEELAEKQKMYEELFKKVDDVQDDVKKVVTNITNNNTTINNITQIAQVNSSKINNISDKVNILTNKVNGIGDDLTKLTGKVDTLTGKVDTLSGQVGGMSNKLDDIANLVKSNNKKVALVAGAAALVGGLVGGLIAWAATKNKKAEEAEGVQEENVNPTPVPENEEENVTPVDPNPVTPVVPTPETEETEPALPLDKDGTYTTKKGDCFWNIAKRHLEDKFKNDPDKFANKTQKEKDVMIQLETRRIMQLNGYSLAEDKWHSAPTLHPNVKIQITEKVDLAA